MKTHETCFAVLFLTYFDTFDIKRYSVFESRDLAEAEFKRIKKILHNKFYNFVPERSEKSIFEIHDCMVKIEELELNKPIDMRGYNADRNCSENYPLVSVAYDENAVEQYWDYERSFMDEEDYRMDDEDYRYEKFLDEQDLLLLVEEELKGIRRRTPLTIPDR